MAGEKVFFKKTITEEMTEIIETGAKAKMTPLEIIQLKITDWLSDSKRKKMITGEKYYLNNTDIQNKTRTLANGIELQHRANTKLEHGFYRKLADQKTGYLLSKLPSVTTKNEMYQKELDDIFDKKFWRQIKAAGRESVNKGIAWLQVYIKSDGKLAFKLIPSEEIIPLWMDNAHEDMEELIRVYDIEVYSGKKKETVRKVEHWSVYGVKYYVYDGNDLVDDVEVTDENGNEVNYHMLINGKPYNWERIPFIPFRYNDIEQPLLDNVKSLIDDYNYQASVNSDLLADIPKFIYKLIGYSGQNLEEFITDLQQYMAIKLQHGGDVDKLQAEPNTDAVKSLLEQLRISIYEFGRGVSTKQEHSGNASGVYLKFLYADLDNDCNTLETEFQYGFEQLLWFIAKYLQLIGKGDYESETVTITFNRDIIINESEVIIDCKNSVGVIPDKQIRANHPYFNGDTEKLWEEQARQDEEKDPYFNMSNLVKSDKGGQMRNEE